MNIRLRTKHAIGRQPTKVEICALLADLLAWSCYFQFGLPSTFCVQGDSSHLFNSVKKLFGSKHVLNINNQFVIIQVWNI